MERLKKKSGKKSVFKKVLGVALLLLIGAALGIACGRFVVARAELSGEGRLPYLLCALLGLYAGFLLHVILHEAGHWLFGLLSGYRFCSFRVGSLMWIRENGRLRLRRYALAGTGGQCLMAPPDLVNGRMPVLLYNLGGALVNLVTGALFLALAFAVHGPLSSALFMLGLVGIGSALLNGIPLRAGGIDNDGRNALSLRRDPEAMRAFWVQLKVNEQVSCGVRLRDMPKEWFAVPEDAQMKNGIIAAVAVFACNRLMDEHRFEEAERLMARILRMASGLPGIYRCLLVVDRAYVELIGENRRDVLESLLTEPQKKMMQALRSQPSVLRTQFACALLFERDIEAAKKWRAQFDKLAACYPYPGEVESERELMEIAEGCAGRGNAAG